MRSSKEISDTSGKHNGYFIKAFINHQNLVVTYLIPSPSLFLKMRGTLRASLCTYSKVKSVKMNKNNIQKQLQWCWHLTLHFLRLSPFLFSHQRTPYHLKRNRKRMHILDPNRKPNDRQCSPSCSLFFLFTDAHKIEASQFVN